MLSRVGDGGCTIFALSVCFALGYLVFGEGNGELVHLSVTPIFMVASQGMLLYHLAVMASVACTVRSCGNDAKGEIVLNQLLCTLRAQDRDSRLKHTLSLSVKEAY